MIHRIVIACLALLFAAQSSTAEAGFRAIASIKPIHSVLTGLMRGAAVPELLVDEGAPFGFRLSREQEAGLREADLVVWVGPELEAFLIDPLKRMKPDAVVLTLLDNHKFKVLGSRWDERERDPFFWLDSRNAIILVDELARELMSVDAPRAHLYKRNRDALLAKVARLDRQLEYGYHGLTSGTGISYYDTLQYFEQAYALTIDGVLARSPQHPVNAKKLLAGRFKLMRGEYDCLLVEPSLGMPDLNLLLGDTQVQMGEIDSFGAGLPAGPDLYFAMMKRNTTAIKSCLRKGGHPINSDTEQGESVPLEIGGKFMLTDHNGRLISEKDLQGKYQLVYFGYTYCPDICPTGLRVMSLALERLGEKASRIQPYLITVDPERDTADVLKGYVGYFGNNLIGLTGSRNMIDRVAKHFNVRFEKIYMEGAAADEYSMDHTAGAFLIGPDGRFITKFANGLSPKRLAENIATHVP